MKRILMVLAVAVLMAATVVVMAAPAMAVVGKAAGLSQSECNAGPGNQFDFGTSTSECDPGQSSLVNHAGDPFPTFE